jgi:hypothetical protein
MKQQAKTTTMKTPDNNTKKTLRKRIIPTIPQNKLSAMFPWLPKQVLISNLTA